MIDVVVALIAIGEIAAGLFYCLTGVVFLAQAVSTNEQARTYFRSAVALLFIVSGLEELADSVVQEGDGAVAYWVQGLLTSLQVATGGLAAWAIIRARRYLDD